MKYIKTYENQSIPEPKFEKEQWVKIVTYVDNKKIYETKPYKIVNRNYGSFNNKRFWEYALDTGIGGKIWRIEKNLELVPDYEIDAKKYNL
jgi:hypothetical protein